MIDVEKLKELITRIVNRIIAPLRNRVYMLITRAVIESVKDSNGIQLVKATLLAGETRSDIERFQNFGFSSHPPKESEALALAVGGDRDHLIIIAVDDRNTRIKGLKEGESVQYNSEGDTLTMKKDGTLDGQISKLKFENSTGEVIDILVKAIDALNAEPFIVNKATFTALKILLETFKA